MNIKYYYGKEFKNPAIFKIEEEILYFYNTRCKDWTTCKWGSPNYMNELAIKRNKNFKLLSEEEAFTRIMMCELEK